MKSNYLSKVQMKVFFLFSFSILLLLNGCGLGTSEWSLIITIGLVIIAFVIICFIYFIFKFIQFIVTAVNLYKEIILREDKIIDILLDIRSNTSSQNLNVVSSHETATNIIQKDVVCGNCKSILTLDESDLKQPSYKCAVCGMINSID
jgi:hypothetical protein